MQKRDRYRGVLLGLACGDAVGRPVEGFSPEDIVAEYGSVTDAVGGGVFDAPPGTTTDDTALAVQLAESLVDCGELDPTDLADRLVDWLEMDGFGVGGLTRRSIERLRRGDPWYEAGRRTWAESQEGQNAGNGSVMRCAPVALAFRGYRDNGRTLAAASKAQSFLTHADPRCTYGCVVLNQTIAGQLAGAEDPLQSALDSVADEAPAALIEQLRAVPAGPSTDRFELTPYVVDTLELALHHGLAASSTAPAIIGAVNEGGDTDTTAAIAGAVAGARHGASSLPQSWLETLDDADTLRTLADRLAEETIKIDEEIIDRNFDVPDHTIRCPECEESLVDRTAPQYCPDCGTNVPEEAAYCPGCGGELVRCPACAATLGVSPQFCPACGSRVGGGT